MTDLAVTYYATPDDFATDTGGVVLDEWSPQRSILAVLRGGAGSAILVLQNDADTLPESGGVLAWDVKGVRALASLLKRQERITIGETQAAEVTTWETPGHLAVYKDCPIFPPNGPGRDPRVDSFAYNWSHPAFDISGLSNATNISGLTVAAAKASWPITSQQAWGDVVRWASDMPEGNDAQLVGPSGGTLTAAPVGDYFLFDDFTTPDYDGPYYLFATGDNQFEVFISAASVARAGDVGNNGTEPFTRVTTEKIDLSALTTYRIAVKVTNWPSSDGAPNPTAFACVIYTPGNPFDPDFPSHLVWQTTDSMKIIEYPDADPGMTFTTVLRLITEEAQALGRLSFVDISGFSDTTDFAGATIEDEANITVSVGHDTALDVITKIQESYGDVRMNPNSWALEPYIFGTLAPNSGVTFDSTNTRRLSHKTEDPPADELLVLSTLGYTRVGTGQHCAFLELGTEVALGDVGTISTALLDRMAIVREQVTVDFVPAEDIDDDGIRFSDSFNRANDAFSMGLTDSAYGGTTTPWIPLDSQVWGIASGEAYNPTGTTQCLSVIETGLTDCIIEVKLSTMVDCGLVWRVVDYQNYWVTNGAGQVYKRSTGGGFVLVDTFSSGAPASGDVLRVVVSGDVHTIFVNGVQVFTTTDSYNNAATQHGIRAGVAGAGDRFDDFIVSEPPVFFTEIPWVNTNFVPGSLATAPLIDGSPSAERVMSIACSLTGDDPKLNLTVVLKDEIEDAIERIIQELKT